jgi:hypothetical protein
MQMSVLVLLLPVRTWLRARWVTLSYSMKAWLGAAACELAAAGRIAAAAVQLVGVQSMYRSTWG